jgi:hypothetical protein
MGLELFHGLYCVFDDEFEDRPKWSMNPNKENMLLALDLYSLSISALKENLKSYTEYYEFIEEFLVPTLQVYLK